MNFLDLSYLENISAGDKAFVKQMLEMFLKETVNDVLAIKPYVEGNAGGQVAALAHKVKGPLQMLNNQAGGLVERLEKSGKQSAPVEQLILEYNALQELVIQMKGEAEIFVKE